MTLRYTTTSVGKWTGDGSKRSAAEIDENFYTLAEQIAALSATAGVGVDYVAQVTATTFEVVMTDGTSTTLTIPTARPSWRGTWAAGTVYLEYDLFRENNAVYMVAEDHIAASTFDANATDGSGGAYYEKWFDISIAPTTQTQSANSWTPKLDDAYTYNRFTDSYGTVVTVPADADVAFDVDTEIHFRQASDGAVTIEAAAGVTINQQDGSQNVTAGLGATATIKKVDTDAWDIFGRLLSTVT